LQSIVVFSKTIEQRGGKVIFWHFKPSVINVCLGLDDTLKDSVKSGELEDLIEGRGASQFNNFFDEFAFRRTSPQLS
jgi:hypothetical protein